MPAQANTIVSRRGIGVALILMGALACDHSEPFVTPPVVDEPFTVGLPVPLTRSLGCDMLGTRSVDGRSVTYDFRVDEDASVPSTLCPVGDRCVAILPEGGGRRQQTICHPGHPRPDTTHAVFAGALSTDGSLLYAATAHFGGANRATSGALWLERPGAAPRVVLPMLTLFPETGFLLRLTSGIWWTGSDEAVVVDSAGALLLRINDGPRGEVVPIPGVIGLPRPAVDIATRRIAWLQADDILVRSIDGGEPVHFATVPGSPLWQIRRITGLGFHGNTALVGQSGVIFPQGAEPITIAQLLLLREGREPEVLLEHVDTHLFGSSSIAYDERSAVIELIDIIPGEPQRQDPNLVKIGLPIPG